MVLGHKHATKPAACGRQYTPQECYQGTQQAQQQAIQGLAPMAPVIPDDRPACTDTNMVDWIDREALCLYLHNRCCLGNPSEASPSSLTMYGTNSCLNWKTLALYYESMHGKQIPPKVLLNDLELSSPSVANLLAPVNGHTHVKQCDCPHLLHLRHDLRHLGIPPKVLLNGWESSSPSAANLSAPGTNNTIISFDNFPVIGLFKRIRSVKKNIFEEFKLDSPCILFTELEFNELLAAIFSTRNIAANNSLKAKYPGGNVGRVPQRWWEVGLNIMPVLWTLEGCTDNMTSIITWRHHLSITCTTSEEAAKVIAEVAKVVAEVAKVITEVVKVVAEVVKVVAEVVKVFVEVVKVFMEVAGVAAVTQRLRRLLHTDQIFQKTIKLNPQNRIWQPKLSLCETDFLAAGGCARYVVKSSAGFNWSKMVGRISGSTVSE
ncbi:hypothetical protein B0H13DRAFT_2278216 [Mycena leptocephala]|nr:hypothetical protein B0H13DRAFT_2278216 [Mycena leptocephala]